ncbi:MAG: alpha/beta hydrolase [Candidatus Nanopelagicales bacterium]
MEFPYAEVELRKDGSFDDPAQVQAARGLASKADDVVVLVHGWNNDIPAARRLYERLTDSIAAVRSQVPDAAGRDLAVVGVLWPSVKWADDDEVAGGGAGAGDAEGDLVAEIGDRMPDPEVAAKLQALVPQLEASADARQQYLDLLRSQLPDEIEGDEDPPPQSLVKGDAETAFERARNVGGLTGGATSGGGAAGFSVSGIVRAARNLLNTTTYYTMRDRAGKVGGTGIAKLLEELHAAAPNARLNLAGHSFGARAVSAAADATSAPVHAVVLLQGAFSHYGFADDWDGKGADGRFRDVPARLTGPLVITHTKNDKAVGKAYAIASRLARQVAVELGGPDDRYGGIGRNGALKTPEAGAAGVLLPVGGDYAFAAGRVSNLRADDFVSGHSAVTGKEVAYALLTAVTTG